jgi:ADP-dependent NAD(P)H-hydrate dehydratase
MTGTSEPTIVTPAVLRAWPLPFPEGGKDERGTVVVVGGSVRTPGAVLLAGLAALRAGAGKLQLATAAPTAAAMAMAVPEAAVDGIAVLASGALDPEAAVDALGARIERADAVLLGPGLSVPDAIAPLLEGLLPRVAPAAIVVIDAVAIGCLRAVPGELVAPLAGRLVLTPNRVEARQLLDREDSDGDDDAAELAVVSVFGEVAAPDGRCWSDGTGSIGLGTSGSGDVLAGLVAGAAARCGDAAQAAVWGSHVHGAAGDRLAAKVGRLGYLARELLDEAPRVLAELSG